MNDIYIEKIRKQRGFYHFSPILLANESVIEPGNFGRICKLGSLLNKRETFVEEVRQDHFPDKPSRLHSIFLLPTLEDAKIYRRHQNMIDNCIGWNVLYKVELLGETEQFHIGCTGIFDKMLSNLSATERDISIAKDYWSGITASLVYSNGHLERFATEVIIPLPVKTARKIEF